jgi:hypothetical protein
MKIPSRTGVTAGVTTGSPPDERSRGRRRRAVVAGLVASGLVGTSLIIPSFAAAAPAEFPNNVVVFPDRDFVTIEGYQDHLGEEGTVEVKRGDQVIGSAKGKVEAGDVAFEINHPGGLCWGAGTGLNVTPDIRAGDVVSISFASGGPAGDTTVGDAAVTGDSVATGNVLIVKGHVGAEINRGQLEQRIIQPDFTTTAVARRDVRALPGALVAAPKGGYSSGITFANPTGASDFEARYEFDTPELASIAEAADLGERAMSWQVQDNDGNRQGLTIAEYGEPGGPGMGGCPAGPGNQAPPQGSAAYTLSADKTSMQVNWTPATALPTAPAVTGYDVTVLGQAANGETKYVGTRTGASATKATITGLPTATAYTVEVRSLAGAKLGDPFPAQSAGAPGQTEPGGGGDTTAPTVTAAPGGGAAATSAVLTTSVALTASESAAIFFTTDGSPAFTAGAVGDTAQLYATPIPITAATELHWVAIDAAGNQDTGQGFYAPGSSAPITAPTGLVGTGGQASAVLRWATTDATITGYDVQLYSGVGTASIPSGAVRTTTDKTLTVTGLGAGTYNFTVLAKRGATPGPASPKSTDFTVAPAGDRISVTQAKWKANDFRVAGSTSAIGGTVSVHLAQTVGGVVGPAPTPITGMVNQPVTAAAAPATGGTFDIRLRAGVPNPRPAQIFIKSSNGTVAGPFATTAG